MLYCSGQTAVQTCHHLVPFQHAHLVPLQCFRWTWMKSRYIRYSPERQARDSASTLQSQVHPWCEIFTAHGGMNFSCYTSLLAGCAGEQVRFSGTISLSRNLGWAEIPSYCFLLCPEDTRSWIDLGDTAHLNIALVVKGWGGLCRIRSIPECMGRALVDYISRTELQLGWG